MRTRRAIAAAVVVAAIAPVVVNAADRVDPVCVEVEAGDGWYRVAQAFAPDWWAGASQAERDAFTQIVIHGAGKRDVADNPYPNEIVCINPARIPEGAPSTTAPVVTSSTTPSTAPPTSTTTPSPTSTTAPSSQQTVDVGSTTFRTSSLQGTTETVAGVTYKVIANRRFVIDGGYLYIDEANVLIRDSSVQGGRLTVNTSAMIQTSSATRNVRLERVAFDGGAMQNRGIQSDTANLYVYNSTFHRTGNAAVEKNDRNQSSDFVVEDSIITGTGGWPRDDHVDGLQVGGARNVTIRNNTIDLSIFGGTAGDASYIANSCLGLWAELGNTGTTLVEGNEFRHCGGSGIYLEAKSPFRWTSTVTVRNNEFGRDVAYWFVLAPVGLPANLVWTGNQWSDGAPLSLADAQRCCVAP